MAENKIYRLGDLIELCDERNTEGKYTVDDVRGISNTKEVMLTKADITDRSLENFQVVKPNYFVFNRRTTRMGEKIGLGYNDTGKDFIVTEDYVVFHIKEKTKIIPEYLFMFFNRDEFDRYCRWDSWGSATEFFNWENMCFVLIPLPPLAAQQKAVAVYNALKANLAAYEQGLEDLKLVCDGFIDTVKNNATPMSGVAYYRLGDLLEEIDIRNISDEKLEVKGINITKEFMPTLANIEESNLHNYKVVNKNQFAFSGMQTGRDQCIRIALHEKNEPVIISPAYTVLQLKTANVLSEYILLWFLRKETDRYGWFSSDGSIRANLDLDRFYDIQIPLPSLKVQQNIVNMYKCYTERRRIAAELKTKIKTVCPILIKGSLENM